MNDKIRKAYSSIKMSDQTKEQGLENLLSEYRQLMQTTKGKDGIVMSKKTKLRKPFVTAAAIAAAVTLTVSAGAAAVSIMHRENVDGYLGEGAAEVLASQNITAQPSAENEFFRVTADTTISDGTIAVMVLTIEGINEEGQEYIDASAFGVLSTIDIYKAGQPHTSDIPVPWQSFSYGQSTSDDVAQSGTCSILVDIEMGGDPEPVDVVIKCDIGEEMVLSNIDLNSNISYTEFVSDDGDAVKVTPITLSATKKIYNCTATFITNDGERRETDIRQGGSSSPDDVSYISNIIFGEVINLDDYTALELDGVTYTKQ